MSMSKRGWMSWLMLVAVYCCLGGEARATAFQNGDFSSGFSGWQGQLSSDTDVLLVDPGSDSHFVNTPQGAQIQYVDQFDAFYVFTLFQEFESESLTNQDNKLFLSFWMQLEPANDQYHFVSATINSYDLLAGTTYEDLLLGSLVNVDITIFEIGRASCRERV